MKEIGSGNLFVYKINNLPGTYFLLLFLDVRKIKINRGAGENLEENLKIWWWIVGSW
jgi:hypothetical protein